VGKESINTREKGKKNLNSLRFDTINRCLIKPSKLAGGSSETILFRQFGADQKGAALLKDKELPFLTSKHLCTAPTSGQVSSMRSSESNLSEYSMLADGAPSF
jgi:hypothetical protein